MQTLRRTDHEPRVEIMPLIDVIFLLLTFFIYAMVLMIRAELLPVQLMPFESGESARPAPAVTVLIDRTGAFSLDRRPIEIDALITELKQIQQDDPETAIYVATEQEGDTDRLPAFLDLYDRFAQAGIRDVKLVGRPDDS